MDIGGWTVDLMRLDNGVPNAATCRSLELGMIRCMEEAREQVLREKGVSVTDAQIERVLSGKNCSLEDSIQSLIRKQRETYTQNLLSAVMEAGFDLKALPVVMMGGGASVVHRSVSQQDGTEKERHQTAHVAADTTIHQRQRLGNILFDRKGTAYL